MPRPLRLGGGESGREAEAETEGGNDWRRCLVRMACSSPSMSESRAWHCLRLIWRCITLHRQDKGTSGTNTAVETQPKSTALARTVCVLVCVTVCV